MPNQIDRITDFVDKAVRNYKYSGETGTTLKRAVALFADVMQEDETASIDLVKDRLDDIMNRIDVKFPNKYTVSSLMVFKSRALRAINDYQNYGLDATKMSSWSPKTSKRSTSEAKKPISVTTHDNAVTAELYSTPAMLPKPMDYNSVQNSQTLELPLQNSRMVTIYYPTDLTVAESQKIGKVLESIASLSGV